jgi:hypothetical protein
MVSYEPTTAKRRVAWIIGVVALGACIGGGDAARRADSASAAANAPVVAPSDTALRRELLARVARDQAIRERFSEELRATGKVVDSTARAMMAIDSGNIAWLRPILLGRKLPTRREVGADGLEAIFLLVQHADADTAFQAAILPRFEAAFAAGELDGGSVALLTDRVMKARTGRQRYGTQATLKDGQMVFDPIDDSAGVDARRQRMGLPPLLEYKRVLDSVYGKQGPRE